jgi:hypothetical protein
VYAILSAIVLVANVTAYRFAQEHLGPAAEHCWLFLFMQIVPTAVAGFLCYKFAREFRSGARWMFVACVALATFAATLFSCDLSMHIVPIAVASILFCMAAKRVGLGGKWVLVACMMLAVYAATQSFLEIHSLEVVGTACPILAHFLVPLAVGWWFPRRKHDEGQLQLAS